MIIDNIWMEPKKVFFCIKIKNLINIFCESFDEPMKLMLFIQIILKHQLFNFNTEIILIHHYGLIV